MSDRIAYRQLYRALGTYEKESGENYQMLDSFPQHVRNNIDGSVSSQMRASVCDNSC